MRAAAGSDTTIAMRRRTSIPLAAALALACACGSREPKVSTMSSDHAQPSPLAADAVAGVDSEPLKALLGEHWDWRMRSNPLWATTLGDRRFDDRIAQRSIAAVDRTQAERKALLARGEAIDAGGLGERDRITLALWLGGMQADAAVVDTCREHEWQLSARENPFAEYAYWIGEAHQVKTPADARNVVSRLGQVAQALDDTIANPRTGLANGRVASAEGVRRTIAQLDGELAKPIAEWPIAAHAKKAYEGWPAGAADAFKADVLRIVEREIEPAVTRYRDALKTEVLPRGRTGKTEGLAGLPDGIACYRAMMKRELGFERAPEDLHELGLAQIERSDREIAAYGKKLLGTADLKATIARLRTDKQLYFGAREQLLGTAESALARARAAIPQWFGVLPKADCIVSEIPAYEAPFTTIAYYRQPFYDGSKPGEYYVNTYQPETRPRFDFEALSYHESIPGHHLQIAIAMELGAMPMFRKIDGTTAFVEGWALYTERLADEMGLYSGDIERLGMWSYDAWRNSRLVVDTGIHALGWTRAEAEAFMLTHTALSPENVSNEVDRYFSTPAQALAYKVGQLEIIDLRAQAEKALGKQFDIKGFHDVVLGAGAVTLPVLRSRVEAWIAQRAATAARQ
jgi:uncharacterized protein (DUF885 family)